MYNQFTPPFNGLASLRKFIETKRKSLMEYAAKPSPNPFVIEIGNTELENLTKIYNSMSGLEPHLEKLTKIAYQMNYWYQERTEIDGFIITIPIREKHKPSRMASITLNPYTNA